MRIIGGRDYYDSALAFGRDDDVTFIRRRRNRTEEVSPSEVGISAPPHRIALRNRNDRRGWVDSNGIRANDLLVTVTPAYVWFAGRRYPAVRAISIGGRSADLWIWDRESLVRFLDDLGIVLGRHIESDGCVTARSMDGFFSGATPEGERQWLIDNRISIAIWERPNASPNGGWLLDTDGLKGIGFAKVVDPYAAMQELSMYVSGVLARPGPPMVEIRGEKSMVAKHGFDEWSFRTPARR